MSKSKKSVKLKRLKSKIIIDRLFNDGETIRSKHLLLKILKKEDASLYAGVSVSKRNFKRAVDRNKIKRQLREVLKLIEKDLAFGGSCMLIFKGRKTVKTEELIEQGRFLIQKEIKPL